jgi:hypothetical protein
MIRPFLQVSLLFESAMTLASGNEAREEALEEDRV